MYETSDKHPLNKADLSIRDTMVLPRTTTSEYRTPLNKADLSIRDTMVLPRTTTSEYRTPLNKGTSQCISL